MPLHQPWINEGVLGIQFTGEIIEETKVGPYDAIVPTLKGECWIHGFSKWVLDETDPFPNGFTIGDIW